MIYLILLLGFALRLIAINQSLWLDEAIGAEAARDFTYRELIYHFPTFDNHPPLYYIVLKFWTSIFGYSEFSLRMPSVIFGVLTILVVYKIAQLLEKSGFTEKTHRLLKFPHIAALLLAISQLHIYYSQEARMYSMAAFLTSIVVYAFLYVVWGTSKAKSHYAWWLTYSLGIALLSFTDYVPIFLFPIFALLPIIFKKDKYWWSQFVLAHLPLLMLWVWWMPIFLIQSEKGRWLLATLPAWRDVAGGATLKHAALVWTKFVGGRISFLPKFAYYIYLTFSSFLFGIALIVAVIKTNRKMIPIWFWLSIPMSLGFVASFWIPAFIYFRFLFVLPAFCLLIAYGVCKIDKFGKLILVLLCLVQLLGYVIYVADKKQQRENWREAVNFLENVSVEGEVIVFDYPEPFTPFRWYAADRLPAYGVTDSISANETETERKTRDVIAGRQGIYYFEYIRDLSDPNRYVEKAIVDEGFGVVNIYTFQGIGNVYHFR